MKWKTIIVVGLILIIASVARLYMLSSIPSGFHADEAAFGYNAYSLLRTGKDEYGKVFPLVLKSFGDYKGAIYAYVTIPSVAIFGLTPFAVRLPTALFGIFFVFLCYLIAKQITKITTLSLIISALLAISPISILLSRVQSDPLVSIVFLLLALYFFLRWIENNSKISIALYAFFSIVSFYTYASPRIFMPLLIFLLFVFYRKELLKKNIIMIFFFVSAIIILVDGTLFLGHNDQRFNQLTIFNNPSVILPMQEQIREEGHSSAFIARVFHNKITAHTSFILDRYFAYINYDFLFAKGGLPDRERIPDAGLMYPIELPFLLLGIYFAISSKKKWGLFLLSWVLLTPLLLAFASDETPNVHRFFFATFPLEFFVGYGIYETFLMLRKYKKSLLLFLIVLLAIFVYSFFYFCDALFVHQPVHHPWYRGYAYKSLVNSVYIMQGKYKKIVITKSLSSPYIYFLFYEKYDPKLYQKEGSPRDLDYTGFGKYYFTPEDCPLRTGKTISDKGLPIEKNVLYVDKATCATNLTNVKVLKTIYWNDGNPAVRLMEYTGKDPAVDLMPIPTKI